MFYLYYQAAFQLHHSQVLLEYLQKELEQVCGFRFSIASGFVKKFLTAIKKKKKKRNKIVMLTKCKLSSIESKIFKALTDNEISHEDFEIIINAEKNIEN